VTALRRAAVRALALSETMRTALADVRDPEDKAKLVQLTSAVAQIHGWLTVFEERQRIEPQPEKAS
jgi:hypothetical protein